jgi:hypothetical protein
METFLNVGYQAEKRQERTVEVWRVGTIGSEEEEGKEEQDMVQEEEGRRRKPTVSR